MNKVLQILFSLVLLTIVFYFIDFNKFVRIIPSLKLDFLLSGLLLGLFRTFIGTFRLANILEKYFNKREFIKITEDSFIAGFYNLFLPTALGGDIPKILLISKYMDDKKKVAAAVVADRYIGFLSLSILALSALIIAGGKTSLYSGLTNMVIVVLIFFILIFLIFFLFSHKLILFTKKLRFSFIRRIIIVTDSFFRELKVLRFRDALIPFVLSFVFQFLGIFMIYLFGLSAGIKTDLIYYLITIPLIWIIIMIPASISGLGLRESAFVYFFSLNGVSNEKALMLSLLFLFQNYFIGLIGGIIQLYRSFRSSN